MQTLLASITDFIQYFLPEIPAEVIKYTIAGAMIGLAFYLLSKALRLLKQGHSHQENKKVNIPRILQKQGCTLDIIDDIVHEKIALRVVITNISAAQIHCEVIERYETLSAAHGQHIACVFAPLKTDEGTFNAFSTKLINSKQSGRNPDRITLALPKEFIRHPRRKHNRKRVADQQFIRVKLWIADPHTSHIAFENAAPHIGVNSFSGDEPDQAANTIINISHGGIALNAQNRLIPETCGVGATVIINLFMFNFKEKSFLPYWYSGKICSMQESRPGFTRIGIEFNGVGTPDEKTDSIQWDNF